MKLFNYIILLFLLLQSCIEKPKENYTTKNIIKKPLLIDSIRNDVRGESKLSFVDSKTIKIITNLYTDFLIDSISSTTNSFSGKYYYCGKSALNTKLFEYYKINNTSEYKKIKNIKTSHCLLKDEDTLYISGRKGIECFEQGDSLSVQSTIYQLFYENSFENLVVIDKLLKH